MVSKRLLAASILVAVACAGEKEDARLEQLTVGIPRDSALRILNQGATSADSLANINRREMYLLDGRDVEILFFSPAGLKDAAVAESTLRPVVVTGGAVSGWGWTYFDSLARVHDIKARVR